ncbi:hypothetical protein RJ035_000783 [Blastomyces gilchristii]
MTPVAHRSNAHGDTWEVLGEVLANTSGVPSSTAVAGHASNSRIESTLHLPQLAFPATARALVQWRTSRGHVTM